MPWDPFDDLSDHQREQLEAYEELLLHFNDKINLISREDEDQVRWHVRHCLTLAYRSFPDGSVVVDWGTGGGLPAIPLAVRFPEVQFHAVDAVRKKVQAVRTMARRLELDNLEAHHARAERWTLPHHYSVSRATAPLATLWKWHRQAVEPLSGLITSRCWASGLLCLKGGNISSEIYETKREGRGMTVCRFPLHDVIHEGSFADKYLLHVLKLDEVDEVE